MDNLRLAYFSVGKADDAELDRKVGNIDFNLLSHIAIAFSLIEEKDGKFIPTVSTHCVLAIQKIKAAIKAQNADTKLLLSVGGAAADGFCDASSSEKSRNDFASELVNIIDRYKLDGVDIDWEFPGESTLGIKSCKHCKRDFILLLVEIKRNLGGRLLTVAVGSNKFIGIDVKQLGRLVDYVFVMTYDLGLMHSNLYLSKLFVSMWKLHGVPKEKLCIGVPFYGRNVAKLDEDIPFKTAVGGRIFHILGQSFSKINGKIWCFDTVYDVEKKAVWARKKNLGGIFCWEISCDFENRLLRAMQGDKGNYKCA